MGSFAIQHGNALFGFETIEPKAARPGKPDLDRQMTANEPVYRCMMA